MKPVLCFEGEQGTVLRRVLRFEPLACVSVSENADPGDQYLSADALRGFERIWEILQTELSGGGTPWFASWCEKRGIRHSVDAVNGGRFCPKTQEHSTRPGLGLESGLTAFGERVLGHGCGAVCCADYAKRSRAPEKTGCTCDRGRGENTERNESSFGWKTCPSSDELILLASATSSLMEHVVHRQLPRSGDLAFALDRAGDVFSPDALTCGKGASAESARCCVDNGAEETSSRQPGTTLDPVRRNLALLSLKAFAGNLLWSYSAACERILVEKDASFVINSSWPTLVKETENDLCAELYDVLRNWAVFVDQTCPVVAPDPGHERARLAGGNASYLRNLVRVVLTKHLTILSTLFRIYCCYGRVGDDASKQKSLQAYSEATTTCLELAAHVCTHGLPLGTHETSPRVRKAGLVCACE